MAKQRASKSLLKQGKKKTKKRVAKSLDEQYLGTEPEWDGYDKLSDSAKSMFKGQSLTWYNYFYKASDLKKDLWKWMKEQRYSVADIRAVKANHESKVNLTVVANATMALRGMPDSETEWMRVKLGELIASGKPLVKEEVKEAKKNVYKPTIQDRMNDQLSEFLGELDTWEDGVFVDKKFEAPKLFEWLKANTVAQAHIKKMLDYYAPRIAEMELLASKKADDDLKEGYKWMKPADIKRVLAFYSLLVEDLEAYQNLKKVTRKVRAKKAPTKDKLVKRLKYMAESKELKLTSIRPTDIVGAQTLWVYNTKTRKLFSIKAAANAQMLSVKGSTIVGYDEVESTGKTLRDPAKKLKEFNKAGKVALRSFLEDIRAVGIKFNGRINNHMILLKAA